MYLRVGVTHLLSYKTDMSNRAIIMYMYQRDGYSALFYEFVDKLMQLTFNVTPITITVLANFVYNFTLFLSFFYAIWFLL